jgi:hypothetical protein
MNDVRRSNASKAVLCAWLCWSGWGCALEVSSQDESDALSAAALAPAPYHVLYVGDSLAAETGESLTAQLEATGSVTVSTSSFPGMALCDFLEVEDAAMDVADRLRARVATEHPDVVVLQFWGNGFTDCIRGAGWDTEAYYNQYFWNALNAAIQIEAGAEDADIPRPMIVWVLQGPQKYDPPLPAGTQSRPERLNGIYAFAANHFGDVVSDAGHDVSLAASYVPQPGDRYVWTQWLPCTDEERGTPLCTHPEAFGGVTQIHHQDDATHFCLGDLSQWYHYFSCGSTTPSPGIERYATRIANDVKAQLGL